MSRYFLHQHECGSITADEHCHQYRDLDAAIAGGLEGVRRHVRRGEGWPLVLVLLDFDRGGERAGGRFGPV